MADAWAALGSELDEIANGAIRLDLSGYDPSSDIVEAIWSGTTHQKSWINNLALSMSNVMRTGTPSTRATYDGTGYQLGIIVRWWWLTLPIAAVAASVLLLVIVMIRTARSRVGIWKCSPLTLLLFDIDAGLRRAVGETGWTGLISGADSLLGKRKVTLRNKEQGGWLFKSV